MFSDPGPDPPQKFPREFFCKRYLHMLLPTKMLLGKRWLESLSVKEMR